MAWATFKNTVLRVWAAVRHHTWPFFLFILGFVLSWVVAVASTADAVDRVRYFGTVLQLLGIALVGLGLSELRRDFDRPGVFARMWAGLSAVIQSVRPGTQVALAGTATFGLAGSVATAYGRLGGSIEQRLDGLEREIDDLRKQADERERQIGRQIGEVRSALSNREPGKERRSHRDHQTTG